MQSKTRNYKYACFLFLNSYFNSLYFKKNHYFTANTKNIFYLFCFTQFFYCHLQTIGKKYIVPVIAFINEIFKWLTCIF